LGAEWMYYGAHNKLLVDYSRPFTSKFQNWLKMRYQKIENLNPIWKKNYRSFAEISVPSPAERNQVENFSFLNPAEHQNVIDLRLFFSELTSGLIEEFGTVIKEASDGRTLCGTYYGYITYTALDTWSENGHFALQKLLESDSIDFLVSLIRYDNRFVGGESGAMTPVNSFRLHHKAALTQADLRTHRSVKANYMATDNLMDSAAVLKRELAWALVSGAVFEFGYYGKGWIASDPRLMELVGKYQFLEQKFAGDKEVFASTSGQIALIVDDASVNYVRQDSPLFRLGNRELIRQLAHAGTGFDTYLLSDLPKIADQYRCFIFSGTYLLSDDQLQYIQQHLQGGGRTLVWMHAPGICDGRKFLPQRVEEATGIRMHIQNLFMKPAATVTATTRFLKPGISASVNRQRHAQIGPRLIPQQGEVLACADDKLPAVVRQVFEEWTSVYSWVANLSPPVLQEIAATAGLTIINDSTDDSTYAAGKMIAIHSNHGGPRTLYIADSKATQLTELFTGKKYPIEHGQCQLQLPPKSTALFFFD
ncbi:MAG: beta-galactosidase, partial [Lentisphaeria bacterium]